MTAGDARPQGKIILQGDPDLRDLIPVYLENRRKDLLRLRAALEQNDFFTIRNLAHRMKGEGGGYGFDAISTIGAALEQAAKDQQIPAVRIGLQDLASYLDRVEVVYD